MNLHQQFPYMARRERRKPVDHGPDEPGLLRKLITGIVVGFFVVGAFIGACIAILFLMGALKACGVKEL
jgi:hypothetical protein